MQMKTDEMKSLADRFERIYKSSERKVSNDANSQESEPEESGARRTVSVFLNAMLAASIVLGVSSISSNIGRTMAIDLPTARPFVTTTPEPRFVPGPNPHTVEGAAAIHKALQEGKVNVSKSTITGIVDVDSMTSSLYWTVLLKNNSNMDKEASAIIELPKNATISRATLWINGVAQEAAFSSNQAVTEAYDRIVVRHRDPLLVTQVSPGKIKILASPVTANGGTMQLRLGITAPLRAEGDGRGKLTLPKVVESNLQFDCKQDVHLESITPISGLGRTDDASSLYVLKANEDVQSLANSEIKVGMPGYRKFATRLTHTSPAQYVVGTVEDGKLVLRHEMKKPDCKFFADDEVAFRMSNLWARQEIERAASRGQMDRAIDLANTYRIVSSVSGATVLETNEDYQVSGLNRDMYRTLGDDGTSHSGGGDAFSSGPDAFDSTGAFTGSQSIQGGSAPQLQGATNGTIGPQGGDATVIQGVNSAGTVRVNNLANLEALINILVNGAEIFGLTAAFMFCLEALQNKRMAGLSRKTALKLAVLCAIVALSLPPAVNTLISYARDLNMFS